MKGYLTLYEVALDAGFFQQVPGSGQAYRLPVPWFIQTGTALLDNRYLDVEPEVCTRRSQRLSMVGDVHKFRRCSNMQVGRT
jgi:hypothetical protein